MFLATTALTEFWGDRRDLLLLGQWCVSTRRPDSLDIRDARIMPSPWNDRERFYEAAGRVHRYAETLLSHLTRYLNQVHQTHHSERYWRIIIGPWTIQYTHVLYDRFINLQTAFATYPDLGTVVMDEDSFR